MIEARAETLRTLVVEHEEDLKPHLESWQDLANHCAEPNVFYEPWFALPALKCLLSENPVRFVLVFDGRELCGFFPVTVSRGVSKIPVTKLTFWKHAYCFLCTPLLRGGKAVDAITSFIDWAKTDGTSTVMSMELVSGEGPFADALEAVVQRKRTPHVVLDFFERAAFRMPAQGEHYVSAALSKKKRKELRRQRARLSELGRLEFRSLKPQDNIEPWIEQFLKLEAGGWKGRQGDAFASKETHKTFFETIVREASRLRRVMIDGLFLDDHPIAMLCNFVTGSTAYSFKIAFDEKFARYSPGVQLELEQIERYGTLGMGSWMDSCARRDSPMINSLWKERRKLQSVLFATRPFAGAAVVTLLPWMRKIRRVFKDGHADLAGD